ncbi:helix-turn-helix transcriptional regulator (plasmid) [Paenibacillus urinalis]|uniref:Helix-turn-helix transcriptional regulator n=1 Tax=Paenibacillus urinalis TaxID=521520 RepID=A0AAX3N6P3_9BACL|nr:MULTISPECIES: helix-turn-helix transcriptional regulator [Paenibacillus]MCM3131095.1 helix-turn-helix domain-containing protein [Paenibacillus sp. MER 78]WDH85317.1 helix-turn-helix transcriptional regulator [Paenibacillus urinalis]WDH95075.1 helix-turn-helix transcriptional regulator [Paenibacillus urinalis]WDI05280.1 helix-turn-helix transcriptional regulator [Paenibacillus urinalis]
MLFGDYIRELRKARELTQDQLSNLTGIKKPYISRLENNHDNPPSEELLIRLAEALEVETYELILKAGKVPEDFKNLIIYDPEVYRFLVKKIKQSK